MINLLIALFWPLNWLFGPADPFPEPLRTVWVDSSASLSQAIADVKAGDHIVLKDGHYREMKLSRVRGTKRHPVVFSAENSRQAIVDGSHDARNLSISNCAYIYIYGIRFTQAKMWSVTIGPAYLEDHNHQGSRNIKLVDCEIDHAGQSLVRINGNSRAIEISRCYLHDSGQIKQVARPYAEGIYVGDGAGLKDRSNDILIADNKFERIGNISQGGEAIDVKCPTYNVRIINNEISDVWVQSGGAINLLLDSVNYPQRKTDPRIQVRGNQVDGVRHISTGYDAAGICVGSNGISIQGNTVKNTQGPAFLSFANAANTSGQVRVYRNKFYGKFAVKSYHHSPRKVSPVIDARDNMIEVSGVRHD
ncbi:MAG: hypothetical protein ACI81V_000184 [Lentimonas sp.]|jgi:hypothetical protein